MVALGEDEEVFARFMTPLSTAFNHLKNALSDANVNPQTPQSVSIFCLSANFFPTHITIVWLKEG